MQAQSNTPRAGSIRPFRHPADRQAAKDTARRRHRQRTLFNKHRPAPRPDYFNPAFYFYIETTNAEKLPRQLGGVKLSPVAWRVLKAVVSYTNEMGIVCYASVESLAVRAECSPNTFRKWLRPWIRLGVVVAIPRPGDGSGALTTLHVLRPSLYWNNFDRKPGQTFENLEASEWEAKRNSEPEVPTTPPSSSSGSDAFPGDCDSLFNPEHSGQSVTPPTKSESHEPQNPRSEFKFPEAPEHPDENVIFQQIAYESRLVDPRHHGLCLRNVEAVRWLIFLALATGNLNLARVFALWFVQSNNADRYGSHVAMVRSKWAQFLVWWSMRSPDEQKSLLARFEPPDTTASPPESPYGTRLNTLADELEPRGGEFAAIAADLRQLAPERDVEVLWRHFEELETRFYAAADALLTPEQQEAIKREMKRQLDPYRSRLTSEQIALVTRQHWQRRAREILDLPQFELLDGY